MKKLSSLTIFFPFLNDEGTVKKALTNAYFFGKKVTNDLEVIAIIGGKSKDKTAQVIKQGKKIFKDLVIIDKTDNREGYAVIKHGFNRATKDWVFYTDGDLQYDISELLKLVKQQNKTGADVVNGYKIKRNDSFIRVFLGNIYRCLSKIIFRLPIKDLDCDFRLIRRSFLKKIKLTSHDSSIILELIKKLQLTKAKFTEIPVHHYKRTYGQSSYNFLSLIKEKLLGDIEVGIYNLVRSYFIKNS